MGQSMKKLATGGEEKKAKEIIIDECYKKMNENLNKAKMIAPAGSVATPLKETDLANFYREVCQTVEEINIKFGNTQLRLPTAKILREAYKDHHHKDNSLTKEEFRDIIRKVLPHTGLVGTGAKDILLYIFGVPMSALFIKNRLMPTVSNDVFIPGITSVTVFILAKLNKI